MESAIQATELAKTPIPGDSPCGKSVKYEDSFQQLEAELAKQESLTAATVDWARVEEMATAILRDESKDMLVACYLVAALGQTRGYNGLLTGWSLLQALCEAWWDEMFPPVKRLRGRSAAINWLVEKIDRQLESTPPTAAKDLELIPALYDTVSGLDRYLAEIMEDKAPDMMGLVRSLRQLKKSVEADQAAAEAKETRPEKTAPSAPASNDTASAPPETTADPAPAPTPDTPPARAPEPSPRPAPASGNGGGDLQVSVGSAGDASKALRQIQDAMRKLAIWYGESKPSEPKRFKLSRYALWLTIDNLPPNKEGRTQVPPPAKDILDRAQQSYDQGDYSGTIESVEKQLTKLPYWFAGQRLVVNALEQLGPSHQAAADIVRKELRSLLERLPGLMELAYSDGTPFVDEATRFWLTQTVLAAPETDKQTTESGDELADIRRDATKLAASGKVGDAVGTLQSFANRSAGRRQEFHARLALAELLLDSGKADAALPILLRLSRYLETHQLAEWEPEFASRCYRLLHDACARQENADAQTGLRLLEQQNTAFAELCWYDPGSAVT